MKSIVPGVITFCLATTAGAAVLTLADAERTASTSGYGVRGREFENEAAGWAKRNAVANYLPTVEYGLDYQAMDRAMIDAANEAFSASFTGLGSMLTPIISRMNLSQASIDSIQQEMKAGIAGASGGQTSPTGIYPHTLTHKITVTQPIFNGGAEVFGIRIARHAGRLTEHQLEAEKQQAVYNARKAYFDAMAASERVDMVRQDLVWAQRNLGKNRTRREGGVAPVTDVLQWEAEVAQKESDLLLAGAARATTIMALYQAMGVATSTADTGVALEPLEAFEARLASSSAAGGGTPAENPRLKVVEEVTKVQEESRRMTGSSFLPKVNSYYTYSWPYYWTEGGQDFLALDQKRGWVAGISATVPLFGGFRNGTSYRKAQNEARKARVQEEEVRAQLAMNQQRIAAFREASRGAVAAARKSRDLMVKQLEIMQQRYDGGQVNQTQLLDISRGVNGTRIAYTQKLLECLLYDAEYRMNIGELEAGR